MASWQTVSTLLFLCIPFASLELISDQNWQAWKSYHGKKYLSFDEEHLRYTIWNENLKSIVKHNEEGHSFKLAMNHLGDLTAKEVKLMLNGYRQSPTEHKKKGANVKASTFLPPSNVKLPDEVDWRKEGYVTPIKNQRNCGSCWSFSATGSLEGQHFKKSGKLISLSEQNLIDCSQAYGNHGCEGGLMDYAFQYIKDNNGIDTEKSYPYKAMDEKCRFNISSVGATDTGFVDVKHYSEPDLQSAVATVGPISVAIDAGHMSFQFYHSGVYDETQCSSTQLDHGVLVVGYGTADGRDYWLVKNSWGTSWGMDGYIQMSRNKDNQCGIASNASYPLV